MIDDIPSNFIWRGDIISGGIHLCNDNIWTVGKLRKKVIFMKQCCSGPCFSDQYNTQGLQTHLLSKFFVFRLQALAVSAPGGVKLDENVFAVIIYN